MSIIRWKERARLATLRADETEAEIRRLRESSDRITALCAAWTELACARGEMLRTPNAVAGSAVRNRITNARKALRALGVDPDKGES